MDPWKASDYLLEGDTDAVKALQMVWRQTTAAE
jgi:hypothetical protein